VESISVTGTPREGAVLRAAYTYWGGAEGRSWRQWIAVCVPAHARAPRALVPFAPVHAVTNGWESYAHFCAGGHENKVGKGASMGNRRTEQSGEREGGGEG